MLLTGFLDDDRVDRHVVVTFIELAIVQRKIRAVSMVSFLASFSASMVRSVGHIFLVCEETCAARWWTLRSRWISLASARGRP